MPRPVSPSPRTSPAPRASNRNGQMAVPGPRGRVRRIVTVTDAAGAVLRRRSRAVPQVDAAIRRLIADMAVTMRHAEGVGLAAVQIGVPLRIVVADTGRGLLALVNPRLRRRSGAQVGEEGCLSIPGVVAPVRRPLRITVDGTLVTGQRVGLRATGYIARILQHEIDHLNGVLFLDRVRASAVRRRTLRPAERRRGVKTAATRLTAAGEAGRARRRSPVRRRSAAGRSRRPVNPWAGSVLTVAASPRRPAAGTGSARS
ncbi:MAG: peptide deformylase [bacterium]